MDDPFDPTYGVGDDGKLSVDLEDPIDIARKILKQGAVPAANTLIYLAAHAQNENTRMSAAKYVVDRNLGRIKDADKDSDDPWSAFLADVTRPEDADVNARRDAAREARDH